MNTLQKLIEQVGEKPFSEIIQERGFPINLTLLDFVKFQLKYIVPITLSDGELTLLAYIHIHGNNFFSQFIADGHSRSSKSVDNYLCKLKKEGIITSNKQLHPQLYLTQDPTRFIHFFNLI